MAWFAEVFGWHDVHYIVCCPLCPTPTLCEASLESGEKRRVGGTGTCSTLRRGPAPGRPVACGAAAAGFTVRFT